MTIAGSGALVFPTELNTELRRTGSLTMPNDITRWLAEEPTGPLTFPTDFYGKAGFKLVDNVTSFSSLGTAHSFASVDFGEFYAGRRIVIVVELRNKDAAITGPSWDLTSVSIGGTSASNASPFYYQDGGASTFLIGLAFISIGDTMTATSGTVSFTSARNTQCRPIAVLSVANIGASTDSGSSYDTVAGSTTITGGVDTGDNGFIIAAGVAYRSGGFSAGDFSGTWTELLDFNSSTDYRVNVSAKNRQTSGAKTVTWDIDGNATHLLCIAAGI
jgi:hypothetical protein